MANAQIVHGFRHTLADLAFRSRAAFQREGDLARRIHVEELRPRVLEHAPDRERDLPAVHLRAVAPVDHHTAGKRSGKERRRKSVGEPCQRRLAASRRAAHEHARALRYRKVNMRHTGGPLRHGPRVGKRHVGKFDHATILRTIADARTATATVTAAASAAPNSICR